MTEDEQQAELRLTIRATGEQIAATHEKASRRIGWYLTSLGLVMLICTCILTNAAWHLAKVITILFGPH